MPRGSQSKYLVRAKQIDPVHPCSPLRDKIRIGEVPVFLKYLFNYSVSVSAVTHWYKRGCVLNGKPFFLQVVRFGNKIYVRKCDLIAFLNWGGEYRTMGVENDDE